jgi:hypothetical protein
MYSTGYPSIDVIQDTKFCVVHPDTVAITN